MPPREVTMLDIPSRHGAYFTGARYGVRKIDIDVTVLADTPTAYMDTLRFLALCMDIEEPTELLISDEPDKQYFAILSGDTDMTNKLMTIGDGTLTFLCADPFAYSITDKTITPVNKMFTFANNGTTDTFPVFTVNFQNDATYVSITSPDGIILIGNPNEPDQIVLPKQQVILNDPMRSITGWTNPGAILDAGRSNTGSVAVFDGDTIGASSFGTGTSGAKIWHGPAIRKDLSSTVQNFVAKFRVDFSSVDGDSSLDGDQMGRLEIYLFSASGVKIGKLVLRDSYTLYEYTIPEVFIGNTLILEKEATLPKGKKVQQKLYTTYTVKKGDTWSSIAKKHKMTASSLASLNGKTTSSSLSVGQKLKVYDKTITKTVYPEHVGDYNDMYGELTLQRIGTTWYAEVCRITPSGSKYKIIKKTFYDKNNTFSQLPLSYVVLHFAQYDVNAVVQKMRVTDVKIFKNNTDQVIDVPSLFTAGDELVVDLNESTVTLNGELFMNNVDVGSTFFPIPRGTTQVKVNTNDGSATFQADYTERFL